MNRLPIVVSCLCLLGVPLIPGGSTAAFGAPFSIKGPVINNPLEFRVTFGFDPAVDRAPGGGPGVFGTVGIVDFDDLVGPGMNWIAAFNITEINGGPGQRDRVILEGFVRHEVIPHPGEDILPAVQMVFSLTFDAASLPGIGPGSADVEPHPTAGHLDAAGFLSFRVVPNAPGGLDIVSWEVTVIAYHAPEPSSISLLVLGTLGLLGYGWRRRQRTA